MTRKFDLQIGTETLPGEGRREVRSPYDGRVVGDVAIAGAEEVARAVAAAEAAAHRMAALPAHRRISVLLGMAHGLKQRRGDIARVISDEAGKPIRYAEAEAERSVQTLVAAADAVRALSGELIGLDTVPNGEGRLGILRRFPLGPVLGISPFNFPLNLSVHKVAPAIGAGCPIVLKPASQTSMSPLLLQQVAREAGLPDGGLTVLPADRAAADPMVEDERFRLLTFTGSAEVGWRMKARAGKKRVVLELGGNAAAVVGPDADLASAVPRLVVGAFAFAGQICISVQRIYVLEPRFKEFLDRFLDATQAQATVGDPADPSVVVGPMITRGDQERVLSWVERARKAGARVLAGGEARGTCITPTVITGADPGLEVCAEEAFAPLVVVEPVRDWGEAIHRVNQSRFGLQCGVFTHEIRALWRCFEEIEVGGVIHNDSPLFRVDHMPYGGVKDSGFGREGPRFSMEEMTELRLLALNPR